MVTFKDILQEGPLWEMIVEEYKAEVLSKGLSQGLSQGLRSALHRAAQTLPPVGAQFGNRLDRRHRYAQRSD